MLDGNIFDKLVREHLRKTLRWSVEFIILPRNTLLVMCAKTTSRLVAYSWYCLEISSNCRRSPIKTTECQCPRHTPLMRKPGSGVLANPLS